MHPRMSLQCKSLLSFLPPSWADNEETEGSDVPADYLLGDVDGEEDELYLLDPEHAHSE